MTDQRLSHPSLMAIENDVVHSLDYNDIVYFAQSKIKQDDAVY